MKYTLTPILFCPCKLYKYKMFGNIQYSSSGSWLYFWIFTENTNGTAKLVLSRITKTWLGAQEYCRDCYTDLAIIRSKDDNDQIIKVIYGSAVPVWIGLYRDTWKWSDRANFTTSTQNTVQKLVGVNQDCATIDYWRTIEDRLCTRALYFYCNTGRSDLNYCVFFWCLLTEKN